jgi:membrane-associated protein
LLTTLLYTLLTLDQTLAHLAAQHSVLVFVVLFGIIFAETGLVVTPFLPGDSLLFIAGAVAGSGEMNVHLLAFVLWCAAVLGDSTNYWIGRYVGPLAFERKHKGLLGRALKPEYFEKTQRYYDKYGGFTLVIGRFIPIVRTFAPFLAGITRMRYLRFLSYSVPGGAAWIAGFIYAGYLFGNIEWVKTNLSYIVVGIVLVSVSPAVVQFLRERRNARGRAAAKAD